MSQFYSEISATAIRFDRSFVSFKVTVKNLSANYASFKVSLTAAGADTNLKDSWYSLDPITSTLIPPGDRTNFNVTILKTPILGMDSIDVEVKVSSVELSDIDFHHLKLHPTSGIERLQLSLPVPSFTIYPRKILMIPIRVTNPNRDRVDIVLRLVGLDPRWLERGSQRRLLVGAGREEETSFTCQPPIVKHTPCGIYPFVIKAYVGNAEWSSTTGTIEILPMGTVFFDVSPMSGCLPSKQSLLPQLNAQSVVYDLEFKNASNVAQKQITVAVEGSNCNTQIVPTSGGVKPGETLNLQLIVNRKRPWFGFEQTSFLKLIPRLQDLRLNTTDPSSQSVELKVQPLLPVWLQLGLGAIAITMILYLLSLLSIAGHSDRVNSVTFDSDLNPILSGSKDGTLRKWEATPDNILCRWWNWQQFCLRHRGILLDTENDNGLDRINVVKLRSDRDLSGKFAFVGFDSGKASKLNILDSQPEETLIISGNNLATDDDSTFNRILDLAIDADFETIFLGRGTKLLQLNHLDNSSRNLIAPSTSIHVLTLSWDRKYIIAGGQRNKIFRIDLVNNEYRELLLHSLFDETADQITGLKVTENNLLVSSDNRGTLNIWNLNRCEAQKCQLLYHSETESGINAIALTKDSDFKYYLATAHTNGTINLWSFREDSNSIKLNLERTLEYSQQITSIDLVYQTKISDSRLLILSGSQDSQVRLNIHEIVR